MSTDHIETASAFYTHRDGCFEGVLIKQRIQSDQTRPEQVTSHVSPDGWGRTTPSSGRPQRVQTDRRHSNIRKEELLEVPPVTFL